MSTEYLRERKKVNDFKGKNFKDLKNLIGTIKQRVYIIYVFR